MFCCSEAVYGSEKILDARMHYKRKRLTTWLSLAVIGCIYVLSLYLYLGSLPTTDCSSTMFFCYPNMVSSPAMPLHKSLQQDIYDPVATWDNEQLPYHHTLKSSDTHKLSPELLEKALSSSTTASQTKYHRLESLYSLRTEQDWATHISSLSPDLLSPLTHFTQDYITSQQHPSSCSDSRFLVMRQFPSEKAFGIGAMIQAISSDLALALISNRVLVYDDSAPPGEHFIEPSPDCGKGFDCIFHPLSNCTSADAARRNDTVYLPLDKLEDQVFLEHSVAKIPEVLEAALQVVRPEWGVHTRKYWWRGQAAAYIMRLNERAMKRLWELRTEEGLHVGVVGGGGKDEGVNVTFPLPVGSWAMHVRHGDKAIEMNLVPFQDYVLAAERYLLEAAPLGMRKAAFVSTEDPSVVEDAARLRSLMTGETKRGWEWYWSEIPRLNLSPESQLRTFGDRTEMTLKWILQLMMNLECDGYVGTRGSNWNRLIDGLRCVWLENCQKPFLEVGDIESWKFYGP